MDSYLFCLKNFSNFSGRGNRKEYWMFVLINFLFAMVALILDRVLGTKLSFPGNTMGYGIIYMLYNLVVILPSLAAGVRRLHDINKSGWMFLLVLIPCIGGIWLLVLLATEGTKGDNQYGPDPNAPVQA